MMELLQNPAALAFAAAIGGAAGRFLRGGLLRALQQRIEELETQRAEGDIEHSRALDALRDSRLEMERRLDECETRRMERDRVCRGCEHIFLCRWRAHLAASGRDITGQIPKDTVDAVLRDTGAERDED